MEILTIILAIGALSVPPLHGFPLQFHSLK